MALENQILSQSTGNNTEAVQVFIENTIPNITYPKTSPFAFEVPLYDLKGATLNFYTQSTDSISSNLNLLKTFTFDFSANTSSFFGITQMQHDIYRLDYDIFQQALLPVSATTSGSSMPVNVGFQNAVAELTVPLVSIFEPVSGSSFTYSPSLTASSVHDLVLPQKVKPIGQYTQDIWKDKSQYFIDSKFIFPKSVDMTYGEVQIHSGNSVATLYIVPTGDTQRLITDGRANGITGGTRGNGTTIRGR